MAGGQALPLSAQLMAPIALAIGVACLALALRGILLRRLARATGAAGVASLSWDARMPSLLWCLVVGIWTGLEAANLPPRPTARLELLLQSLVIATTTLTSAGLLVVGIATFARYHALALALTGLSQAVIRAVVIVIGGLVLLGHLGITITPILTALGIGGLAVALALQDTLSNLFAGFHLLADQPVSVGDVVRLENGMEGVVEDIGWRSTRIRQPGEDLIIVPNAKLAQSILTNRLSKRASGRDLDLHGMERTR
jgi:small-conductance mechanosensitive channel